MTGHMPHVRDSRSCLTKLGCRIERDLGFLAVPEVDAIVVCRVHRVYGENLLKDCIDGLMAVNREAAASELPETDAQKGQETPPG